MRNKKNIFGVTLILFFLIGKIIVAQENHGLINWITFSEAIEKCKKQPKMIMIDVFTTWCGPCKLLTKQTFGNDTIAKYLNKNFYCVKFDAENRDTLKFSRYISDSLKDRGGNFVRIVKKSKEYKFVNTYPLDAQRSLHEFAASILAGYQIAYPSIVFLTQDVKRCDVLQGFYPPLQFEPIMKFFGSGSWEKIKWEDYLEVFKSEFKKNG